MITRGPNFQQVVLNVTGSSTFGRYPKISIEKTYNMFESDHFMVPYAGYQIAIPSSQLGSGSIGRGIFASIKFDKLVVVIDTNVYLVDIDFNQMMQKPDYIQITHIGTIGNATGVVYITENNKPQILISDGVGLYVYDPSVTPSFQPVSGLNFIPGYITFHDTYFICAASEDQTYTPFANNTWRLSLQNEGLIGPGMTTAWPSDAAHVGLLETKPDNVQAVVRFPSKGNMIFVMGSVVTESWFDTGAQLFPYQRDNQFNIDYGCLSPATVAYMDEYVVWLAANERSGPIIMYSQGGMPKKITTDGIDYLFSTLQFPSDSQAFLYRQDGHLFYHINFYSDNLSLFYDFNTDKFYHACDQNLNYFIASEIAFFNNQYYFVTQNNGNLFAFDTQFTTYQDVDAGGIAQFYEIPRIRSCRNVRLPSQEYFIANDVGFTIESGETNYLIQYGQPFNLITQDGMDLVTQSSIGNVMFITQDGNFLISQDDNYFISQADNPTMGYYLITNQSEIFYTTPRVDLSISYDGGASFGTEWGYILPPIGIRKNRLMWWQCGIANDMVCQFKFWGIGRFVCTDGILNART